ncbi:hypothetical protein [Prevotella fusca]
MKIKFHTLIIFLQLLTFFGNTAFFIHQVYRADKEMVFVDIPVKHTKGDVTGKEYGITITRNRGSYTVRLESDSFPGKHFEAHHYTTLFRSGHSYDAIIESRPASLGCYLEPDFKEKQGIYTPFVYSGQREKSSVYYLNLISYVNYEYAFYCTLFALIILVMCFFTKKKEWGIVLVLILLSTMF